MPIDFRLYPGQGINVKVDGFDPSAKIKATWAKMGEDDKDPTKLKVVEAKAGEPVLVVSPDGSSATITAKEGLGDHIYQITATNGRNEQLSVSVIARPNKRLGIALGEVFETDEKAGK